MDLLICDRATVELKGPHLLRENFTKLKIYENIRTDFRKQRDRATQEPNLQHFVLWIVHAPKLKFDSIQRWLLSQLESDVRQDVAGININLKKSEPLVLNGNDWLMLCCLYKVR